MSGASKGSGFRFGDSVWDRLAITLLLPAALWFAGSHVALPGIKTEGPSPYSIFQLGLVTVMVSYAFVELVALLVPGWRRLRDGNPEGRQKLERAARFLALGAATLQACVFAQSTQALVEATGGTVSVPVVTICLLGGLYIQFVVAQYITRKGLLNGFVALAAVAWIETLRNGWVTRLGLNATAKVPYGRAEVPLTPLDLQSVALAAIAVLVMVFATMLVARGAGLAPSGASAGENETGGTAYRDARRLALHPALPLPSGSFSVYPLASALLMLPSTLAFYGILPRDLHHQWLLNDSLFNVTYFGALVALTWGFSGLMNRTKDLSHLVERLGGKAGPTFEKELRAARRAAFLPSVLFFTTLVIATAASHHEAMSVVVLTSVAFDFAYSTRTSLRHPDFVPVWDERRAAAVPILRAALAGQGIATEVRGAHVLHLWQSFIPYAPAQILVARADAIRARASLESLLLGAAVPNQEISGERGAADVSVPTESWSMSQRTKLLAACVVLASLLFGISRIPASLPVSASAPRAKLELVRVDDLTDVLAEVNDSDIPEEQGIARFAENAPVGMKGETKKVHFARITFRKGESKQVAAKRLQVWLDAQKLPLPPTGRFAFEEVVDYDEDTKKATVIGLRTFLLVGESGVRGDQIEDANAAKDANDPPSVYVSVTLTAEGGKGLEAITRDWTGRRMAILIDGEVNSAPVIRSVISGRRMSVTMGAGDFEKQMSNAKHLADGLRAR